MLLLIVILIVFLILNGMPLFAGLGSLAFVLTWFKEGLDSTVNLFIDPMGRLTQNELLLPIPLFTLMGYIIARSGAPDRIVNLFRFFLENILGKTAASLGIMAVLVSAFFTPLTGASGVTIVALGGILMPVLQKARYPEKMALGIVTASGSLGLLFFPSVPVIIYGIVSNNKASISDLFKAGILPGILLILLPSLYILWKTPKNSAAPVKPEFKDVKKDLGKLFFEIMVFPLLFFLFMSGKITVSEIGLMALLYFFLLEVVLFKEISYKHLSDIVTESMGVVGGIIAIVFFASAFTSFMIDDQVPQKLFQWIQQYIQSRWSFLILLNLFLLMVGAFMDIFSAIIVMAPLVIPVAELYGVNMVHLGILFLTNLEIGFITPPVGMNLFLSAFRFKTPMPVLYRSIAPFLLILILAQILITYVPQLSLWLVSAH